jgi:peptidoglycan/LPS O-acetylase OafA/YrhL
LGGEVSVGLPRIKQVLSEANVITGTFLVQSTIIYSIGINFWLYVDSKGNSEVVSNLATFFVCAPLVAIVSEIFYRLVDLPSIRAAKGFWNFMVC